MYIFAVFMVHLVVLIREGEYAIISVFKINIIKPVGVIHNFKLALNHLYSSFLIN